MSSEPWRDRLDIEIQNVLKEGWGTISITFTDQSKKVIIKRVNRDDVWTYKQEKKGVSKNEDTGKG